MSGVNEGSGLRSLSFTFIRGVDCMMENDDDLR